MKAASRLRYLIGRAVAASAMLATAAWFGLADAQEIPGGGYVVFGDMTRFLQELRHLPAEHRAHPTRAQMLAVAQPRARGVVVGGHGTALLAEGQGKGWGQAREGPTPVSLTSGPVLACDLGLSRG